MTVAVIVAAIAAVLTPAFIFSTVVRGAFVAAVAAVFRLLFGWIK